MGHNLVVHDVEPIRQELLYADVIVEFVNKLDFGLLD
jgi:hypothetical protein